MVVAPALIDLSILLVFLALFALCLIASQLAEAILSILKATVGRLPLIGSVVGGTLDRVAQIISHTLGIAAVKLQHRIAVLWHSLARIVEETAGKIGAAFELIFALSAALVVLADWHSVVKLFHSLVGQDKATVAKADTNTQVIHKTTVIVKHVDTKVNTVTTRVQAIPADVVVPGDLAGLRGQVRSAEDEIARLWERVRGLSPSVVGGVAVGALAFALSRLGIGWARCSNVGKVGKNICGMNTDLLEGLLAGSVLVASSISLVDFAKACQEITGACEDGVSFFVREVK